MMNVAEQDLLREVLDGDLGDLDEDALVALHTHAHRARNKYSKLYRRRSAARVQADKSRAKARPPISAPPTRPRSSRTPLAKVSRQLARAARASAEELKHERLAAAHDAKKPKRPAEPPSTPRHARRRKRKRRTGASKRGSAPARAATRRGKPSEPSRRGRRALGR